MEQTFLPLPAGHSALQAEEGAARESYDSDESPWLEDEEELEQIAEVVGDDPEQEADLVGHIGIRRAGHYLPVIVATAAFVHQGGPCTVPGVCGAPAVRDVQLSAAHLDAVNYEAVSARRRTSSRRAPNAATWRVMHV